MTLVFQAIPRFLMSSLIMLRLPHWVASTSARILPLMLCYVDHRFACLYVPVSSQLHPKTGLLLSNIFPTVLARDVQHTQIVDDLFVAVTSSYVLVPSSCHIHLSMTITVILSIALYFHRSNYTRGTSLVRMPYSPPRRLDLPDTRLPLPPPMSAKLCLHGTEERAS